MVFSGLLKRTVLLPDRSTGKPARYSIVVGMPRPQPGSDAAAEDATRKAEVVGNDAQAIFKELIASGRLKPDRRR
jgi:hypothetical protein